MKPVFHYPAKPHKVNQAWGVYNPVYQKFGFSYHNGVDIALGEDKKIYAPFPCEVAKIGWQPDGAGLYVSLVSLEPYDEWAKSKGASYYIECTPMHLEKSLVKVGDKLSVGDEVAIADNTGFSTGPHTHLAFKRVEKKTGYYVEVDHALSDYGYTFNPDPYWSGRYAIDVKREREIEEKKTKLISEEISLISKVVPLIQLLILKLKTYERRT